MRDINLSIREGEILGLAGLVGAGRTELGRAIFGAEPLTEGQMFLRGQLVRIRNPQEAIRSGIGYVTEDRKGLGLFLKMTLRENCASPSLGAVTGSLGLLREGAVSSLAEMYRQRFRIVTPSIRQQVRNLSGGNQQKVLLAMWMGIDPVPLVIDKPTRGVDIGARSEMYQLLRKSAARGVALLMISSDLPELLGMCDRIAVMRDGRITGCLAREEATEENIIALATGWKA